MNGHAVHAPVSIVESFIRIQNKVEGYKSGKLIIEVDGRSLSIAAIVAAARHGAPVGLDASPKAKECVDKSRAYIENEVSLGRSLYGVLTGVGGSANTRTSDVNHLSAAILQHVSAGILPTGEPNDALPLSSLETANIMPKAWVIGAIMLRMNSMVRGHSGVRWVVLEALHALLTARLIPVIPLRGSISASGDLLPLSHIASSICGDPAVRIFCGEESMPANEALAKTGIQPVALAPKEPLAIVNGTSFSTAVSALAVSEASHLALLSLICTAMATEALFGSRGSFAPFLHEGVRPHPGQVDSARSILHLLVDSRFAVDANPETTIQEDSGKLRQDRYALRTAPQFVGPQLEDIYAAVKTIDLECNCTTDNPLVDIQAQTTHMGGNFQGMATANAMEKTRASLYHIGKILFSQTSEIINPVMSHGLPPNVAATDPSLNYHAKGLDVNMAAYTAELGFLASSVTTHAQSAEMHNQNVNSMALVAARATITSVEVLSMLIASHIYVTCQALDIRAMQLEFHSGAVKIVEEVLSTSFKARHPGDGAFALLKSKICGTILDTFDATSSLDVSERMPAVARAASGWLVDLLSSSPLSGNPPTLADIKSFTAALSCRLETLLTSLRVDYLTGARGPSPATPFLGNTGAMYKYVRETLGVPMHGRENLELFEGGLKRVGRKTIGYHVSVIQEAIRDGKMKILVGELLTST